MQAMRSLALLAALCVPAAAAAFDANGVALGGAEALVKKQFPSAHCKPLDWKSDAADRRCDDAHIAFHGAEARITFFLKNDAVQAFDLRFSVKDVQKVVSQLKSGYGTPHSETNDVINRKGGEKREVYKVLWQRGKDRALLVSIKDRERVTLNVSRGNFEEEIYRVK